MELTLRQLRAFLYVVETGQFTAAAQRMYVTQSALSGLIRELESCVRVRLFDRHTRRVELTDAGQLFLEDVRPMLLGLDSTVKKMHELASADQGKVRVVSSTVLASGLLSEAFMQFKLRYPNIDFELRDVAEEDIMQTVLSGEVDFGLGTATDVAVGLVEEPLFTDYFIALFPSGHRLAQRQVVKWEELAAQPFIALSAKSPIRKLIDREMDKAGIELNQVTEVSFSTTVLSLVSAGLGVSVLPMNNHPLLPTFDVKACRLKSPVITRQISIFRREHKTLPPAATLFARFLKELTQK